MSENENNIIELARFLRKRRLWGPGAGPVEPLERVQARVERAELMDDVAATLILILPDEFVVYLHPTLTGQQARTAALIALTRGRFVKYVTKTGVNLTIDGMAFPWRIAPVPDVSAEILAVVPFTEVLARDADVVAL